MSMLLADRGMVTSLLGRPGEYYVDAASGSDSNSGTTRSAPLLTLAAAKTKHGSSTQPAAIFVRAPQATPFREQFIWDKTVPLTIEPMGREASWFLYGSEKFTTGWTLGGSVWSRAVTGYATGCNGVFVSTLTDSDGNWKRLIENTATPTTPAAGEYGQSIVAGSGTIYVRLPADASANSHTIECAKRDYGMWARKAELVTTRYGRFYAANVAGHRTGSTTGGEDGTTVTENSEAWYCNVGGFATATGTWTSAKYLNCKAFGSLNDGFNIHGGESGGFPTGTQLATLTNCESAYNLDEGSSTHERSSTTITGGRFHHNGSGGIGDVGAGASFTSGVESDHNWRGATDSLTGAIGIYETRTGSITGCNAHDNPREGIKVAVTASVTVSGNTSGLAAGNGFADNLAA